MPHLKYFELAQRQRLLFRENTLTAYEEFGEIHVFDLHLATGARQHADEEVRTAAWLEIPGMKPLDFKLVKEDLIEKAKAITGMQDIDFEEYPKFSSLYRLSSNNPEEIRSVFKPGLIQLLEQHNRYQIEAKGRELLILPQNGLLLPAEEIRELISFSRLLVAELQQ